MSLKINFERCIKCGACARICPLACITYRDHETPFMTESAAQRCMKCQHCLSICPKAALSIWGYDPDLSVPNTNLPSPDAMMSLIKNRRSCRAYKQENVDKIQLSTLCEALSASPTGTNSLGLHLSFIDDVDVMNAFRIYTNGEVLKQIHSNTLPEKYQFFSKYKAFIESGRDPIFRGAPHAVFVSVRNDSSCKQADPFIALSYFELLAHTLGLATTWWGIGFYLLDGVLPHLKQKVGIPSDHQLGYAMLFGVPAVKFKRATQRPPISHNRVSF